MKVKDAINKALAEGNIETIIALSDVGVPITEIVGEDSIQKTYNDYVENDQFEKIETLQHITNVPPRYTTQAIHAAQENYFKKEKNIVEHLIHDLHADYKLHLFN